MGRAVATLSPIGIRAVLGLTARPIGRKTALQATTAVVCLGRLTVIVTRALRRRHQRPSREASYSGRTAMRWC